MLIGIIAAQSTDMHYIILFLNISDQEINIRFGWNDTVFENVARCQIKIVGACMYH